MFRKLARVQIQDTGLEQILEYVFVRGTAIWECLMETKSSRRLFVCLLNAVYLLVQQKEDAYRTRALVEPSHGLLMTSSFQSEVAYNT